MNANRKNLEKILKRVKAGSLEIEQALNQLGDPGYTEVGSLKIDHDRQQRRGFPEVILCEGKTTEQVVSILKKMDEMYPNFLASRASDDVFQAVSSEIDDQKLRYNKSGRVIIMEREPLPRQGAILVVSAGAADQPVLEECAETARIMGNKVDSLTDAGVAGVHRLLNNREQLNRARVIVVVAGMDGALPSVVGGLVDKPVIAVPTSVGYGASFGGLAPLLTMLNSCAAGVGVVNIDNGFGAAYLANSINKLGLSQ